jgi:hypothetical protein
MSDPVFLEVVKTAEQAAGDGSLDEETFEALRRLCAASGFKDTRRQILASMRFINRLSGEEVIVMMTSYRLFRERVPCPTKADEWNCLVARESGIGMPELVRDIVEQLIQRGILWVLTPGRSINDTADFGLTSKAIKLGELLEKGGGASS